MVSDTVDPEKTLAIILGAHEFPRTDNDPNDAFLASAQRFRKYLLAADGFGLSEVNLHDLFDSRLGSSDLLEDIEEWLGERLGTPDFANGTVANLVVYYVGHGAVDNDDYVLLIRKSRTENLAASSLVAYQLARSLTACAQALRRFVILDCCYAGVAIGIFQSNSTPSVLKIRDGLSSRGTALLGASPADRRAISPEGYEHTAFSGCLLDVLEEGVETDEKAFAIERVRGLVEEKMRERFAGAERQPPRPIHGAGLSPDILKAPLFPNHGRIRPSPGGVYHALINPNSDLVSQADLEGAARVLSILPVASEGARMQRKSLQVIAQRLTRDEGLTQIIDFGSGFPTNDHIHRHLVYPIAQTLVVYSDNDARTVRKSNEIILQRNLQGVIYVKGNAGSPEEIVAAPSVKGRLDRNQPVGLVFWGLGAFMSDEQIEHAMEYLYNWAEIGTVLVFQAQAPTVDPNNERMVRLKWTYEKFFGTRLYLRSLKRYCELLGRWNVKPEMFTDVATLVNAPIRRQSIAMQEFFQCGGVGAGVFVKRKPEKAEVVDERSPVSPDGLQDA